MKAETEAPLSPIFLPLFLISAATLTFEITLTRLFSVAQFYHFAFMIVSIALLGFGASGTALTIFPNLGRKNPNQSVGLFGFGAGLSILLAYLLINKLPFDSFSIAWDNSQIWILISHYLALATPFFFSGMTIGLLLDVSPKSAGRTYAVNLLGSALGCVFALFSPPLLGAEGTVTLSSGLALLGGLICLNKGGRLGLRLEAPVALLFVFLCIDLGLRLTSGHGLPLMKLHISPYKGFSYAMQYPNAELIYSRWNAFSRVDVIRSGGIHSIPGLSYRYLEPLPAQDGLLVDGDNLSAILPEDADLAFSNYLPMAIAFDLQPEADTLILEPRGGLIIAASQALGAANITAVEGNPLIVKAAAHIYNRPNIEVILEADRTYLQREREQVFDVILVSLTNSYHPVRSGAYSLAEDYRYTVEAFEAALTRLRPNGVLVITRWLQDPPSESLRTFALAIASLENNGGDPESQIVAFRGYNTITFLLKNGDFTADELKIIRSFCSERAFDLVFTPDLQLEEINRFNILPEPIYFHTFTELIKNNSCQQFFEDYAFDVRPPTDNHPFMGHYFKWSQTEQILAEFGHTWQPFGGAGYFVILALLALAVFSAGIIIIFPLAIRKSNYGNEGTYHNSFLRPLFYFGFIGLAFLLVEIPLLQRYILYLGNPAYALTTVLFSILLFSAIGSRLHDRISHRIALSLIIILVLIAPSLLAKIITSTLSFSLTFRSVISVFSLAPLGFLMGIPFPAGIQWLRKSIIADQAIINLPQIPWIWAVNGAASVVSSVLAALLALTYGFTWVLRLGALFYAAALFMVLLPLQSPRR